MWLFSLCFYGSPVHFFAFLHVKVYYLFHMALKGLKSKLSKLARNLFHLWLTHSCLLHITDGTVGPPTSLLAWFSLHVLTYLLSSPDTAKPLHLLCAPASHTIYQ